MSEEEEILSNADASYGGTTDAESVISVSTAPGARAPEEEPMELLDEDEVPQDPLEDDEIDVVGLDENDVLGDIPECSTVEALFLFSNAKMALEDEKPKSEDLLKLIPGADNTKTTKELIAEVADNVHSCRVCYDLYHHERNQARILCCGHSFCTRCVVGCSQPSTFNRESGLGVKCPECRRISKQAPASMPVNFQFMQLLTVLSLVKDPKATPEPDEKYQNFERLGQILPENELSKLTMEELHEHTKVIFRAMRQRAETDKEEVDHLTNNSLYNSEIKRFDGIEKDIEKLTKSLIKHKKGDVGLRNMDASYAAWRQYWTDGVARNAAVPAVVENEQNPRVNNDWMREMVVYRDRNVAEAAMQNDVEAVMDLQRRGPVNADNWLAQVRRIREENRAEQARLAPDDDIEVLLEQEAQAREGADPLRNLDAVREAHFRRERQSAQQREEQRINEQIVRRLVENPPLYPFEDRIEQWTLRNQQQNPLNRQNQQVVVEEEEEEDDDDDDEDDDDDDDEDDDDSDSDDSSIAEEELPPPPVVALPRDTFPTDAIFQMTPPVTLGECSTVYRLVDTLQPRHQRPGNNQRSSLISVLTAIRQMGSPTEEASRVQVNNVREYARVNKTDAAALIQVCRDFAVKYSSNIFEAPRLLNRLRRRRAAPADEYNALLTVIRKRAKEALKGNSPTQPVNQEESNLTLRLIVNIANQMGVREQLEDCLCPHRTPTPPQEEIFVESSQGTSRAPTVFCNVCRCTVPVASQEDHAQGRRHVANVNRRQNAIATSSR